MNERRKSAAGGEPVRCAAGVGCLNCGQIPDGSGIGEFDDSAQRTDVAEFAAAIVSGQMSCASGSGVGLDFASADSSNDSRSHSFYRGNSHSGSSSFYYSNSCEEDD